MAKAGRRKKERGILTDEEVHYINALPSKYRNIFRKAFEGVSMAAAVKAKCLDCQNYQHVEAGRCEIICPLLHFNPYRRGLQHRARAK